MSAIRPFRALRPAAETASRVAAVPYDVVSTDEARAIAAENPLSFLHVSRAEIDLPPHTSPYDDRVYARAAENFERLRREAPLVLEDDAALYVYRLRMGSHEQTGVAACYSLDEYDRDLVKKHERTRRDKEDDRTRHTVALRAQTGMVFLTYRADAVIDETIAEFTRGRPLYDFEAEDAVRHTIWRAGAAGVAELVQGFGRLPALYVADGHHRAASAARARDALRAAGVRPDGAGDFQTFLAVAFPHDQMQILPYHRIVKDLAGRTPDAFLGALGRRFELTEGPASPARPGEVALYVGGGRWRTLRLERAGSPADRSGNLDVSLLHEQVLQPLLQIGDVRTDPRIDFVGGARGTAELQRLVDAGRAAGAFSMHPVSIQDLMAIADAGGIMPPKSTWFEPKLRDGLLIHLM
jgi:uncharacterized protein (DUF1015 family)